MKPFGYNFLLQYNKRDNPDQCQLTQNLIDSSNITKLSHISNQFKFLQIPAGIGNANSATLLVRTP